VVQSRCQSFLKKMKRKPVRGATSVGQGLSLNSGRSEQVAFVSPLRAEACGGVWPPALLAGPGQTITCFPERSMGLGRPKTTNPCPVSGCMYHPLNQVSNHLFAGIQAHIYSAIIPIDRTPPS